MSWADAGLDHPAQDKKIAGKTTGRKFMASS